MVDLSKLLDPGNGIMKAGISKGGREAVKWVLEDNSKELVKEKLDKTISNILKLFESDYDSETYQKVKDSIENFKKDILEFVYSKSINKTLGSIDIKFLESIQAINNLSLDDSFQIISYEREFNEYLRSQTSSQTLSEKINLTNIIDNEIDDEVNAYQQESKRYIECIREKKIFVPESYNEFFSELKEKRFLIIEGSAGIGKTTLSEWILEKVYNEYKDDVVLKTNFEDINKTIDCSRTFVIKGITTVIYLNDFFGSNVLKVEPQRALEALEKLENSVKTYTNLFIIINSRDNMTRLLKDKLKDEEFNNFNNYTKELSTQSYKDNEKWRFIVNFREESSSEIFEKLTRDNLEWPIEYLGSPQWEIIERFNPRIITRFLKCTDENMTEEVVIRNLATILRNPFEFYKEELESLSQEAKILLFNLFFLIPYMQFTSVEGKKYFKSLSYINLDTEPNTILLELYQWIEAPNEIRFKDPGIIDFIDCYLASPSPNSIQAITTIETSYYYFRQIYNIKKSEDSVEILFEKEFEDELEFLGNKLFYLISKNREIDLKLLSDYIDRSDILYSRYKDEDSSDSELDFNMTSIRIGQIINGALNSPNHDKIFEFLFFGTNIDWSKRIHEYYEFEEIVEEFVLYINNTMDFSIEEFIEGFQNEISSFIDNYIIAVQNLIDEEWYTYISIESDTNESFFNSLDYQEKCFFKNQFIDEVSPIIDSIVKQNLSLMPLDKLLLKVSFDYSIIIERLLWQYEEKGYFDIYEFTRGCPDDFRPNCQDFWETGISYDSTGKFKIVED